MRHIFFLLICTAITCRAYSANSGEVVVRYNGTKATVEIAADLNGMVSSSIQGADVTLTQAESVAREITYRVSGSTNDGSLTLNGSYKITLSLEGVELTNTRGAAIQVANGKRIAIVLADGTNNVLTDMENGSQKACFFVKGHGEFQGGGSLTINGRGKHAYKGNEYVEIKASTGIITILATTKDGIHTDGDFIIKGGVLTVNVTGEAYWDDEEQETKAAACINTSANVVILGGEMHLTATGSGGKGLKADSAITISGGWTDITTTGTRYIYEGYTGDPTLIDSIPDSLKNSPKALKADDSIAISDGRITIHTEQDGGEGIESKTSLTISGGEIQIDSYDDCLNSSGNVTITGGQLHLNSRNNDGIDTNQSLYIQGGTITTLGSHKHELGIDVNFLDSLKRFAVQGGTLISVGSSSKIPYPRVKEDAQPLVYYTGFIPLGTVLSLRHETDQREIISWRMERDYTTEAGGLPPQLTVIFSSPELAVGEAYALYDGQTDEWLATAPALDTLYSRAGWKEMIFAADSFKLGKMTLPYRYADIHPEQTEDTTCLVVYLHGGPSRGNDNNLQLDEIGVEMIYRYLQQSTLRARMVVPHCPKGTQWDTRPQKALFELIRSFVTDGKADSTRVYLLGGSMGGTGTWKMLSEHPDFFAGAMPVAGNPTGSDVAALATTPVYTVMGSLDDQMSIEPVLLYRQQVDSAGGVVRLDTMATWTHQNTCDYSYSTPRLDWLFAQRLGVPAVDVPDGNPIGDAIGIITENSSPRAVKILLNGHLYIRSNGRLYDMTGRFVKPLNP